MAERILVVDDDENVLQFVSRVLAQAGYTVTTACEPDHALRLAHESPPDLAILDVNLPALDGFDLAQMLSEHDETADVPILFMTVEPRRNNLVMAKVSGGSGYVEKPFKPAALLEQVRALLPPAK